VEVFSVLPHLRDGQALPEHEYTRQAGLPQGPCPAPLITIAENGEAYTCCTPGSINNFFSIGNTRESTLAEIRDRFYLAGKQQLLRERGPGWFASEIQARGEGHRLRASYTSICDLCTHIASDPVMASVADEAARDFEERQIASILDNTVEPGTAERRMTSSAPSGEL
jgi:hypothetical protein